jgi:hypothetical protein
MNAACADVITGQLALRPDGTRVDAALPSQTKETPA